MAVTGTVKIIIRRSLSDPESPGWEESYTIPATERMTALQVLQYIYEKFDPTLGFEYSCRYGKCGLCGIGIDMKPRLACTAFLKAGTTVLAPLQNLPVIRDLIIDREPLQKLLHDEKIFFGSDIIKEKPFELRKHDKNSFAPLQVPPELSYLLRCHECLCCHAACPGFEREKKDFTSFAGPFVFVKLAQLMHDPRDSADRRTQALNLGIKQCADCRRCYCPQGIPIYRTAIRPLLG